MTKPKRKSSGWLPGDKRSTWQQRQARRIAEQTAQARLDCARLGLWRSCPARRCRCVRGCAGNTPWTCAEERRPNIAEKRSGDPRAAAANTAAARGNEAPRFAMSAAEAAAAIAASIAGIVEP